MRMWRRGFIRWILSVIGIYGLVLAGGFFCLRLGWTNAKSAVDPQSAVYETVSEPKETYADTANETSDAEGMPDHTDKEATVIHRQMLLCKIKELQKRHTYNAQLIAHSYAKTGNIMITEKMLRAVNLAEPDRVSEPISEECLQETSPLIDRGQPYPSVTSAETGAVGGENGGVFPWMNTEEWQALQTATVKEAPIINRAASEAGIEPRLLVACLVAEQTRLFHSSRDLFKKFFQPLKILGNATQFSLGVMGMKEATAKQTELYLSDTHSPFFPGPGKAELITVPAGQDPDQLRLTRLTDDRDHSYNYLYAALYIRELSEQWKQAGFPIQYRPEIIGTLYNVGFTHSVPKAHPEVGGALIQAGDRKYTFGSLAYEFYYSGELLDEFPYIIE